MKKRHIIKIKPKATPSSTSGGDGPGCEPKV